MYNEIILPKPAKTFLINGIDDMNFFNTQDILPDDFSIKNFKFNKSTTISIQSA